MEFINNSNDNDDGFFVLARNTGNRSFKDDPQLRRNKVSKLWQQRVATIHSCYYSQRNFKRKHKLST